MVRPIGCQGFRIRTIKFKTQICLSHGHCQFEFVGLTGAVKSLSGEEESKEKRKVFTVVKGIQNASAPEIP
jgi:hypothetical protein